MLEEILKGEVIRYCIIVATMLGVIVKVTQTFIYINLCEESENIPASRNKLIKQMKLKFENCYKLNLGVNNVNAFVDKYMYKHKICGLSMYHFNRIPIIAAWLCGIAGIASGCICYLENYSVKLGSIYEIYGIGSIVILKLAEIILDTSHKKNVLYTNLIDFFENSLQNHLTHDVAKVAAVTEEERQMLEEIPVISEAKNAKANKDPIVHNRKKEKLQNIETQEPTEHNAEAIIQDVISQFLS
jgi:hypothetical protein